MKWAWRVLFCLSIGITCKAEDNALIYRDFGKLTVVQGWFQSDYNLMKEQSRFLPLLRDKLGINAILVRPPEVFNSLHYGKSPAKGHLRVSPEAMHETKEEFLHTVQTYRDNGFKIFLYTGIPHLGHRDDWNKGIYQKEHPDYLQQDAKGVYAEGFGQLLLCPNSPALDEAITCSLSLIEQYQPDYLMFDNNFFRIPYSGEPACFCRYCQEKFRDFMITHYQEELESRFQTSPEQLTIPEEGGPLRNAWIDWRSRSWRDALQKVREALPIPFITNTEYMWNDWQLGTDYLYSVEDAVFSESNVYTDCAVKFVIGNSFAPEKRHFSYLEPYVIGGERFWAMEPPEKIRPMLGNAMVYNVQYWLMFHGWDPELGYPEKIGDANQPSQELIIRYFAFDRRNRERFAADVPVSRIGVVVSARNRMFRKRGMAPPALAELLKQGVSLRGIYDLNLAKADLSCFRYIVLDDIACLSDEDIAVLRNYVATGGRLVVRGEVGTLDELGILRAQPIELPTVTDLDEMISDVVAYPGIHWSEYEKTLRLFRAQSQEQAILLPTGWRNEETVMLDSPELDIPQQIPVRKGHITLPEGVFSAIVYRPEENEVDIL